MVKTLIAANWKMHKDLQETRSYFSDWRKENFPEDREVVFFPPAPLLAEVSALLPPGQGLGGQHCHEADFGAFTGENSCGVLRSVGCTYVLVGHSERRHLFGESLERVGAQFASALRHELRPVLCVGETLKEREAGRTLDVVLEQLMAPALSDSSPASGYDVAYEPVWAIGTGKVATPQDAADVHSTIRRWLDEAGRGRDARILYGGSAKAGNAAELLAAPGVDGLLVGGASLDPNSFHAVLNAGE